jgi:hypothetical protein
MPVTTLITTTLLGINILSPNKKLNSEVNFFGLARQA